MKNRSFKSISSHRNARYHLSVKGLQKRWFFGRNCKKVRSLSPTWSSLDKTLLNVSRLRLLLVLMLAALLVSICLICLTVFNDSPKLISKSTVITIRMIFLNVGLFHLGRTNIKKCTFFLQFPKTDLESFWLTTPPYKSTLNVPPLFKRMKLHTLTESKI